MNLFIRCVISNSTNGVTLYSRVVPFLVAEIWNRVIDDSVFSGIDAVATYAFQNETEMFVPWTQLKEIQPFLSKS